MIGGGGHADGFFAALRMTDEGYGFQVVKPGSVRRGQTPRSPRVGGEGLDEDAHRRVVVQRDARAVDQAEAGAAAGDFCDQRGFTEAHFPDPLAEAVVAGQRTNPPGHACG